MVDRGTEIHAAGHEADLARSHANGEAREVRGRVVRVLLEEMMLGGPERVEARLLGSDSELEILAESARLGLVPRLRPDGGGTKDSELHRFLPA